MRYLLLFTCFSLILSFTLEAQGIKVNQEGLQALKVQLDKEYSERNKRINKYLKKVGKKKASLLTSKPESYIYDIVDGQPIIMSTYNEEAAEAIGADAFYEDGELGIGLTGLGEEAGIWDGGIIRTTHQELKGRIMYFDGAASTQFSDHSTSVAGTMLGSGVMGRARGMAYEAIGIAYDFNNDEAEMVTAQLQRGLILSNHSYGPVRGWSDNTWQGDPSISDREDYRFGLYDGQARSWDQIAFEAPYYLMVKSAGNDRGDSGTNGNFPADGPFDCIAGSGLSKNVMTVGAIQKSSQGYDDPRNIRMSSFSGWGPTDDGRIKPDLSAVGVSIYSPHAADDGDYQFTQGTSFSAPSACGGLLLLQQLYKKQFNQYMRSATLKALAIQSIREAGTSDGPDYQFGWGILDAKAGAEVILSRDNENVRIIEDVLNNGEEYIIVLEPKANTSLKATLVWTDLPGQPVGGVLDPTDLMLVNDLDMRVSDETGESFMPWILNPAQPSFAATKGDNFRDNVEKIEVESLDPRKYFLTINHKGDLDDGAPQAFSLILEYQSEKSALTNLYWIGDESTWSTSSNWSAQSGGLSVNATPEVANKIVFDNNSFSSNTPVVTIDDDFTIGSLVSFSDQEITFDLMGNTLTCTGSILLSGAPVHFTNGTLILSNSSEGGAGSLNLNNSTAENFDIIFDEDNQATWTIQNSNFEATSIAIVNGELSVENSDIKIEELILGSEETNASPSLTIVNSDFLNLKDLSIYGDASFTDDSNSTINFNDAQRGFIDMVGQLVLSTVTFENSNVELVGEGNFIDVLDIVASDITMANSSLVVGSLFIQDGSQLSLPAAGEIWITADIFQMDSGTSMISSGDVNASVTFTGHYAFCIDEVLIRNVDLLGSSSVSVGTSSNITNALNWATVACDDLLFADYSANGLCADGLTMLNNTSNGRIQSTLWKVNGDDISDQLNTTYSFPATGTYDVTIVVTDLDGAVSEWTDQVEIVANTLDSNYVIKNSTSLASFKSASTYQWYKNDVLIEGETSRILPYNGELAYYYVVTSDGVCNRRSAIIDFTTSVVNVDIEKESGLSFYPIPVQDVLNYTISLDDKSKTRIQITDLLGRILIDQNAAFSDGGSIDVSSLSTGMYMLIMTVGDEQFSKKFVKD